MTEIQADVPLRPPVRLDRDHLAELGLEGGYAVRVHGDAPTRTTLRCSSEPQGHLRNRKPKPAKGEALAQSLVRRGLASKLILVQPLSRGRDERGRHDRRDRAGRAS